MRSRPAVLVVVAALAWAPAALAAEPRQLVVLRGPGATTCPERAATEAAVAARLGYRPFSPQARSKLTVRYRRSGQRVSAKIELRDEQGKLVGSRALDARGRSCAELARRVALAIAIAIDPLATSRPATPEADQVPVFPPRAGDDPPPAPPPAAPPAKIAKPKAARRSPGLRLHASVGGLLAIGAAPSVNGGFSVGLRLRWRQLSLGLAGRFDLPGRSKVAGGEVSAALLLGELSPCYHIGPLAGCAMLQVGALRGSGSDLADAANVTLVYAAAGARAAWQISLISRFSLTVYADLLAALTRISLRETSSGDAFWTTPVVSGAFGLAATFELL